MTEDELRKYAREGFNRVPITRRILADLETPLSVYLKLSRQRYTYLLESVEGGEKWGRYSIIGLAATTVIEANDNEVAVRVDGDITERLTAQDPFEFVREFLSRFKVPDDHELARFAGGLVGYFGYDTVRHVEPKLAESTPADNLRTPDILLMLSDEFVVFDNLRGEIQLVICVDPANSVAITQANERLEELSAALDAPIALPRRGVDQDSPPDPQFSSEYGKDAFLKCIETIKSYIVEGDVMQVVLAQRLATSITVPPIDIYRALRHLNPSPYLYFMDFGEFQVVGSSPEILVRLEGSTITTRPLAGTRPRGNDELEDQRLEEDLLSDPKELAEHLMLIDLGRNDVGKVARTGSVHVTEKMVIERYSNVMHISSNIEGQIADGYDAIDVLCATLPVGTLSGAPKIRAMEIIDELEPVKRGIYGGAVGYLSFNGNMDTAIAIRTAVVKDETLYIQAGCGVVADSVAELEWEETMNKGRAMFRAVAMAERGLKRDLESI